MERNHVNNSALNPHRSSPNRKSKTSSTSFDRISLMSIQFGAIVTTMMCVRATAQTWTPTTAPASLWASVASSADGTKLVAVASGYYVHNLSGPIYPSFNSGATWTQTSAPLGPWKGVSSSADGT